MKPASLLVPALAAALLTSPSAAQEATPPAENLPPVEAGETILLETDTWERMTVPVSIGGRGPYRFVVDTGAERTVIAREVARDLQLDAGRKARVHSMTEVRDVATVVIPKLEMGDRHVKAIHAPALAQHHLGAEGMLGVDALRSQRVSFDFDREEMVVEPSSRREDRWTRDSIVVTARSRFGRLVLVDASVDGEKVWVIIDTGSQVTVGNSALRARLERKGRIGTVRRIELLSVTGGRMEADQAVTRRIRIGGMDIRQMPVAFADVHPFRKLDLMDRPALLLGMDALQSFKHVSVDFANRQVRLLARPRADVRPEAQLAGAGARPVS
jgi:predicted aspartyl protease